MRIRIDGELGGATGWGICWVELVKAFLRLGHTVELCRPVRGQDLAPWDAAILRPLLTQRREAPDLLLCALGNHFTPEPPEGAVGLVFLEDTHLTPDAIARAKRCRTLVAGSTWCAETIRAAGLDCGVFLQGVDSALFCHGPAHSLFGGDHPVIFSGGKLEYRKGQDIVVAAFRDLLRTHPHAVLVTHWVNAWPQTIAGIEYAGHVKPWPVNTPTDPTSVSLWLARNLIPTARHIELGRLPHHVLPYYLRGVDLAVFPNRCEGGTNLVAQECLAMGIPTIVSRSTGHLDLGTLPDRLHGQPITRPAPPYCGSAGWLECDPVELAEAIRTRLGMERRDPSFFAARFTWDDAATAILDHAVQNA